MIKVEGFNKAKGLLSRKNYWESFTSSEEEEVVERIIADVRNRGDEAVFNYTRKLDGVELGSLEVSKNEILSAYNEIDKELISALELAAGKIHAFHSALQRRITNMAKQSRTIDKYLGQQIHSLDRVGLYVPGGTAAYPSTALMMAIPASVAGVGEIIMTSPPAKGGKIPAATLVAADIASVNRLFKVGGAQAIAALAFGTQSIPKVDKICGPGNIFVTLAKKRVYGVVAIDGLEGPSEAVIIADNTANPVLCAADLLAQAEHDPSASVILLTTSAELANQVDKEIAKQLTRLKRHSIATQAINAGMIVLVDYVDQAVELANLFAPEHLSLMVSQASSLIDKIHNVGCIFVGENSPIVLGDYVAGPSHVLPTGGSARFSSPLSVTSFLKFSNIVALDEIAMRELSQAAIVIAKAEGLDGHALAVEERLSQLSHHCESGADQSHVI
ncbi:MAG: histidinol dehydrogenase [Chloroflexota bacterium]|nr:histidinol dehydrogenase [Chloroflexota bacterium]